MAVLNFAMAAAGVYGIRNNLIRYFSLMGLDYSDLDSGDGPVT